MTQDQLYIKRCFDLAKLGIGNTSPNPIVGSVIIHNNRIIGEGFHKRYGGAHAEVEAVKSIRPKNAAKISKSTIYVSFEPCNIYGKTPPCSELILKKGIPNIVISAQDKTPGVNGLSVEKLKKAGRSVTTKVLEKEGISIGKIRNTFVTKKRPYIIIKFAKSLDGFIGKEDQAIWMTNPISKRLTHKWRSEVSAIMVGTNTALVDNPRLSNRLYFGKSPLRIVLDKKGRLPHSLALFDASCPTWIIGEGSKHSSKKNLDFISMDFDEKLIPNLLNKLWEEKHDTLLVEGGAKLIQSFIQMGLWDEIRMFTANKTLGEGIQAPIINFARKEIHQIGSDQLEIFRQNS